MKKELPRFPLLAKVLGWLLLHLMLLALAFVAFVGWQLRLGLDSLLSGSAGDRLRIFGEAAREELVKLPRPKWNEAVKVLAERKNLDAAIFDPNDPKGFPLNLPGNVYQRAISSLPPPPPPGRRGPPPGMEGIPDGPPPPGAWDGPPEEGLPGNRPPPPSGNGGRPDGLSNVPASRPVFLMRANNGDGYWAGVHLSLPGPFGRSFRQHLLIIRAENLDGSGMFFDFKPWLWGGMAVLALSLAFWTPFVWGITRYLHRLTSATDRIAAGDFKIALPRRGNDELGNLGKAIETMASRLDHLISGQKRFLGDAAHELCAPLARLRTGLGILEMKLTQADRVHLTSVESEAQELATLVEEILAFSRVGGRAPRCQAVLLEPLVQGVVDRERGAMDVDIQMPAELAVIADPSMLARAVGNLVRNAAVHGGAGVKVTITASSSGEDVLVSVTDNGPGVAAEELARLFEPFYRPDRSRNRDTGGSGLGLAIVRTAVEACGGEATARVPAEGGFSVCLRLLKANAADASVAG